MSHDLIFDRNFFDVLDQEDERVAAAVQAAGCPVCAGRLDQARYPRKPRGGDIALAGEALAWRRSWCCAREGCRKRVTPPSLVFLGRRVYLAITVVVAAWRDLVALTAPPRRTVRRWQAWFATLALGTRWFEEVRGRLAPPWQPGESLPAALVARVLPGRTPAAALIATLRLLAPRHHATPR